MVLCIYLSVLIRDTSYLGLMKNGKHAFMLSEGKNYYVACFMSSQEVGAGGLKHFLSKPVKFI